ncbi:MAG: tetratricopeptide repeat protein [Candidatus Krumholzibacteriota bacterium]|nr:tetratricopeptide repeat protein [Candidatus Krumholzibacteriota bacterium]
MKTSALIFGLIAAAALLLIPGLNGALAGQNEDFRFAEKLRSDGMFIAAAEEYIRFCEKYPESSLRPGALFSAGESWMQAGKPREALETFKSYIDSYPEDKQVCKALFYRGRVLKKTERYKEGASEFLLLADEYRGCPLVEKALLEAGESLLSASDPAEAAKAFKRLINEYRGTALAPRALYGLSLALTSMGRELKGYATLEELAENYPDSPVAAFALLKLGVRASDKGRTEEAETYFNKTLSRYEETAIREKALLSLIKLYYNGKDYKLALKESERFIEDFKKTDGRDDIYITAINAASEIGETDKSLLLIENFRKEFPKGDSTGWTYVKSSKLLRLKGETEKALKELERMKRFFPESSYSPEVLLLKADLNYAAGFNRKAARYYNMALAGDDIKGQEGEILVKLAGIYSNKLSDTLAALTALKEAAEVTAGGTRQEALFETALLEEASGDYKSASENYLKLIREYPDGDRGPEAERRLKVLKLRERWNKDLAGKLGEIASSGNDRDIRMIESGITFYNARDFDTAIEFIENSFSDELPEDARAKANFYLGRAYFDKYKITELKGDARDEFLDKARSLWLNTARDYNNTRWGEEAHRAYLDCKFKDWNLATRLKRLDEFIKYYEGSAGRWWALEKKLDFLYQAAVRGEKWASESAITLCRKILSASPPDSIRYRTIKKKAYLHRDKGNTREAEELLTEYISGDLGGAAKAPVCYDLGEIRISLREYEKALDAYNCSLRNNPAGRLAENSHIRRGDCYLFMKRYGRAQEEYGKFAGLFPSSSLSDVAEYRRGLALERMRKTERADSIFSELLARDGIKRSLRVKLLSRAGRKYYSNNQFSKAVKVYKELVMLEETAGNVAILAEALRETGDLEGAALNFSRALELEEPDICRVLEGRAKAYYRLGEYDKGEEDLDRIWSLCAGSDAAASVLLEKGMIFISKGEYKKARQTLDYITEKFKETEYSQKALYYQALCDIKSGGYEEAERKLNAFLAGSPHSSILCMAYFKLASVQLNMEKLNLAARNFSLASEACSDSELSLKALRNLARIYEKTENWDKASATWEKIIERHPADSDIIESFFKLGFSYSQAGRFEPAYDVYSRIPAIAVNEKQLGRAHYWAGISLKNLERYREAVREFLRVPYLGTGGMWGVTSKLEAAGCYSKLERYDEAERIYTDIISSHGKDSDWGRIAAGSLQQVRNIKDKDQSGKNGQKESK